MAFIEFHDVKTPPESVPSYQPSANFVNKVGSDSQKKFKSLCKTLFLPAMTILEFSIERRQTKFLTGKTAKKPHSYECGQVLTALGISEWALNP